MAFFISFHRGFSFIKTLNSLTKHFLRLHFVFRFVTVSWFTIYRRYNKMMKPFCSQETNREKQFGIFATTNTVTTQFQSSAQLNQLQIKQSKFIMRHIYQIAYWNWRSLSKCITIESTIKPGHAMYIMNWSRTFTAHIHIARRGERITLQSNEESIETT